MALPVSQIAAEKSHLYLWVPNALLPDGLAVMKAWGFAYKGNIIWEKVRKDGGPDGRGVGFYFRNVTEILLFGVRGAGNRTLPPARSQVNLIRAQKREHSRKPDEFIPLIERCSPGPFLELFARGTGRAGPCGATRPPRNMSPRGTPIRITRKRARAVPKSGPPKKRPDPGSRRLLPLTGACRHAFGALAPKAFFLPCGAAPRRGDCFSDAPPI